MWRRPIRRTPSTAPAESTANARSISAHRRWLRTTTSARRSLSASSASWSGGSDGMPATRITPAPAPGPTGRRGGRPRPPRRRVAGPARAWRSGTPRRHLHREVETQQAAAVPGGQGPAAGDHRLGDLDARRCHGLAGHDEDRLGARHLVRPARPVPDTDQTGLPRRHHPLGGPPPGAAQPARVGPADHRSGPRVQQADQDGVQLLQHVVPLGRGSRLEMRRREPCDPVQGAAQVRTEHRAVAEADLGDHARTDRRVADARRVDELLDGDHPKRHSAVPEPARGPEGRAVLRAAEHRILEISTRQGSPGPSCPWSPWSP